MNFSDEFTLSVEMIILEMGEENGEKRAERGKKGAKSRAKSKVNGAIEICGSKGRENLRTI